MPRQPRLDAPGVLHHVMARGIEKCQKSEIRNQKSDKRSTEQPMIINSAKDLIVYRVAYELAMAIFEVSKTWPPEERYSLIDQIRRASRSVCSNIREAWAKRRYEANFISKLTDADGENSETDTWLDFAKDCGYLTEEDHNHLTSKCSEVGKMLGSMLNNPEKFLLKN